MARSDNTPWRPRTLPGGHSAPWYMWPLPAHTGRYLRRQWNKQQRRAERDALSRGEEPQPARPRHSVTYDYW